MAVRWRKVIEQKTFQGTLWVTFGMEQLVRGVWEQFTIKKAWARSDSVDAEKEREGL